MQYSLLPVLTEEEQARVTRLLAVRLRTNRIRRTNLLNHFCIVYKNNIPYPHSVLSTSTEPSRFALLKLLTVVYGVYNEPTIKQALIKRWKNLKDVITTFKEGVQ